jgi:peptide/nickel transport system permease protein
MWAYAARRLAIALPVLFVISVLDFAFISLAPGDPIQAMLPHEAQGGGAGLDQLYEQAGLRDSFPVRYVRWLAELAKGNFGTSFRTGRTTASAIGNALPNTLLLNGAAMAFALLIGIPLGVLAAYRERSWFDELLTFWCFLFTSLPSFFLALLAVFVFAVGLSWFPATGARSYDRAGGGIGDSFHHLVLPALVLGLLNMPGYVRYARSSVIEVMREDYIRTARAKGLPEARIAWRHTFPNALLPVLTVIGVSLPGLIGSSVLVEQVFAWPGMGQLSIQSALYRDYPVFMASSLIYAGAVLLSSTVTDLAYAIVNPRIRY